MMRLISRIVSLKYLVPVENNVVSIREAHVRETPWKKNYLRRKGYRDTYFKRPDTLPRLKSESMIQRLSNYKPPKPWAPKYALYGQNDYIDILGDGSIHPVKLLTNMPVWLRGFQGNEFQMLLKKQIHYKHWRWSRPTKWMNMNKRIMHLYYYLNRKTKS